MPIPVVSIAEMREWERATWAAGQTEAEVIRRVGVCVGRQATRMTKPGDLVLILAGKGNNGQDAACAREHLPDRRVELLHVKDPSAEFSKLDALLSLRPALVIDGLFGIGLNRPLAAPWIDLLERVNAARTSVLAVDVPSGLNGDTGEPQGAAVRASVTLTVGAPKKGLLQEVAWPYVGRLEVADDVGLLHGPAAGDLRWTMPQDFEGFPPPRAEATHKGTYGHLAILAGSLGFHGAAVLASRGAQRAQPGLITLHTLETIYPVVAAQLQAVMVSPWRADTKFEEKYSAVVVGPGLASPEVPEQMKLLARRLWQEAPMPVIADASALAWLPEGAVPAGAVRLMTPHPGEAARLLGNSAKDVQANRLGSLRELSKRFGDAWIVLKGHQTLIGRSSGEVRVNSSGNAHLAQGGSGDVLSGLLGGLLTQTTLQQDPLRTIAYAVWRHGAAADQLQSTRPHWVIEDLIDAI